MPSDGGDCVSGPSLSYERFYMRKAVMFTLAIAAFALPVAASAETVTTGVVNTVGASVFCGSLMAKSNSDYQAHGVTMQTSYADKTVRNGYESAGSKNDGAEIGANGTVEHSGANSKTIVSFTEHDTAGTLQQGSLRQFSASMTTSSFASTGL